jgi:DNA-directed RNA polymerase subunit RPC12/RpoP
VYFTYGLVAARDGRRARQPYRNFRHLWRQRGTQSLLAMLDVIDTAEPRKRLLEAASMAGALDDACRVLDPRYDRQIQCPRCGAEFWLDWRKAGPVTCSKCDHEVMPGPADRTLTALLGP